MVMVTKREAVVLMLRGALRALRENDEICALTLAGAAEEAMPRASRTTAYDVMKSVGRFFLPSMTDKQMGDNLNLERNWLKHHNVGEPKKMNIDIAQWMMLRAMSRYMVVYGFDELTREYGTFMGWPENEPEP